MQNWHLRFGPLSLICSHEMNGFFREGDKGKFKEQISHITSPIFLFVVAVLVFIEEIYECYIKENIGNTGD